MKTLFGMTAAVLLVVSLLFVSLPGTAGAAEKVTLSEMVSIKKAADEAAQAAKAQAEKAKTAGEKRLAKQLVKQAETNAEVAGNLLEAVKAGEEVSREEAEACAAIAKAVYKAAGALAAGDMGRAGDVLDRIAELESSLPTAANAAAEMQRAGTDKAGKNQSVTEKDILEKEKKIVEDTKKNLEEEKKRAEEKEKDGRPITTTCPPNSKIEVINGTITCSCIDGYVLRATRCMKNCPAGARFSVIADSCIITCPDGTTTPVETPCEIIVVSPSSAKELPWINPLKQGK